MSDQQTPTPDADAEPETASPFAPPQSGPDPAAAPPPAAEALAGLPTDKPEVLIGGALAGGFLAALVLKRFGRR